MIFKRVEIENYGIYGGSYTLDLVPVSDQHFEKPIVLFRGKNGVGKTTLVETIRLCMHGPLALGRRVSRAKYKEHLLKRIHRSYLAGNEVGGDGAASSVVEPDEAALIVEFDYFTVGKLLTYRVERRWRRTPSGDVSEHLSILENGEPPADLLEDQKEHFLRDLISPNALDLFFFDGEKLKALAKDDHGNTLLADTVRTLLGLHLVDQLRTDLDVYVGRKLKEEAPKDVQVQIEQLEQEYDVLIRQRDVVIPEQQLENIASIESIKEAIAHQEELIAREGGSYAIRVDNLKCDRITLAQELEIQRRHVQEMCNGLLPFSVAPKLSRQVAERLALEVEYKRWKASQDLIAYQVEQIESDLSDSGFWSKMGVVLDADKQAKLTHKLCAMIEASMPVSKVDENEVIMRMSEPDRAKLTGWIEQALHEIPQAFAEGAQKYLELEKKLYRVKQELSKTPDELILQPLVETLKSLEQKQEKLHREHDKLAQALGTISYKAEQQESRLRNLRAELQEQQMGEGRLELASKAQEALAEYADVLTCEKIALLEQAVVQRFNELTRKEEFINGVAINADTFRIELMRGGKPFERDELSEGEKQLLATAVVWALRDISGLPFPIVVDTPLGRLDSDHRLNMIQRYFPRASHQVILLATDTEVDEDMMDLLAPAVSHGYQMEFDRELARTIITPLEMGMKHSEMEVMP